MEPQTKEGLIFLLNEQLLLPFVWNDSWSPTTVDDDLFESPGISSCTIDAV